MTRPARTALPFSTPAVAATAKAGADADLKICTDCGEPKALADFPYSRGFSRAGARVGDTCRDCVIKAQAAKRERRSARTRSHVCPTCRETFKSEVTLQDGRRGKACPQGHWHAMAHLYYFEKHGRLSNRPKKTVAPDKAVRIKLARIGIAARTEQLTLGIQGLLAGYDKLLRSLPTASTARGLVEGSFGKSPELCRELLKTL